MFWVVLVFFFKELFGDFFRESFGHFFFIGVFQFIFGLPIFSWGWLSGSQFFFLIFYMSVLKARFAVVDVVLAFLLFLQMIRWCMIIIFAS